MFVGVINGWPIRRAQTSPGLFGVALCFPCNRKCDYAVSYILERSWCRELPQWVKLCGHGTLAAAHFLWTSGLVSSTVIEFATKSGILTAKKVIRSNLLGAPNVALNEAGEKFSIELDFPVIPVGGCNAAEMPSITETLNGASIVELSSGKEVVDLHPNFDEIQKCAGNGLIVTAPAPPGSEYDIFTRFFCPKFGINEASPRGGRLDLQLVEETQRVCIRGEAVTVMVGSLLV
ncbi:hypothetical protein GW17_00046400 [Ensete ventricosum]|nr:hypothetical protein GW17_00046400 [Ensete ventricosum]